MSFDFIFMLTASDATVPDARARLSQALEGGARHIGFKDVGLPLEELKILADEIRDAGGRSYLEVVSLDEESELRGLDNVILTDHAGWYTRESVRELKTKISIDE